MTSKKVLQSRTILFSILLAVFGALEANLHFFSSYLPPWATGAAYVLIAGVVTALRFATTQPLDPVASKGEQA